VAVRVVQRRETERGRVLDEAQRLGTLADAALDLGPSEYRVPQLADHHRHEHVWIGRAPLIEDEVVPRHHAVMGELLVLEEGEQGPTEARQRREVDARVDALRTQVGRPQHRVVARRAHVVEPHGFDAPLLARLTDDGVGAHRGDALVLEGPPLPLAIVFDVRRDVAKARWHA